MQVNIVYLKNCLDKAREMTEHYKMYVLNGGNSKKSGLNLHELCETYLQRKVTVYRLAPDVERRSIRGFFLRLADGSFVVVLLHETNPAWDNFTLCKELFHVVLDDEKYRTIELLQHLESVVATFPVPDSSANPPVELELLAEVAAMEFCFPLADREKELQASTTPDYAAISEKYGIPQSYVEFYMSEQMMGFLGAIK